MSKYILDTDVPNINVPLLQPKNVYKRGNLLDTPNPGYDFKNILQPTKYVSKIKSLIERSKEKANNLFNKSKEEVLNLFDKYRNNVNKGTEKITNWYNHLKENVLNIFNKIQEKSQTASGPQAASKLKFTLVLSKKAFKNVIRKYEINDPEELDGYDPITFLNDVKGTIIEKIIQERNENRQGIKVRMSLICLMEKNIARTEIKLQEVAHFSRKQEIILEGTNLEETYEKMVNKICNISEKG